MKKKDLVIGGIVLAVALTIGVTVYGANEIGKSSNMNYKDGVSSSQSQSGNSSEQPFNFAQINDTSSQQQQVAIVKGNVQEILTELEANSYPVLAVQKGVPVKWTIKADAKNLSSCNNEIAIPAYGISKKLNVGENIIEFTPTDTGVIPYSCWMGMINGSIAVVKDVNNYDSGEIQEQIDNIPRSGCCG